MKTIEELQEQLNDKRKEFDALNSAKCYLEKLENEKFLEIQELLRKIKYKK